MSNIIETMQSKFDPSAADGLDLIFQFNIEDGETYHSVSYTHLTLPTTPYV